MLTSRTSFYLSHLRLKLISMYGVRKRRLGEVSRFVFPYVYPVDVTTITENTVFLLLCNSTFHISQVTICEGLFMDSCVSLIYLSLLTPIIHCLNLSKMCSFSSTLSWLFWAFFHLHINLSSLSISRKKACWDFDRDSTEFINLGRNCIFITEFSNLWIWDIPLFTVSQFISGMLSSFLSCSSHIR